jgi:hypothetical protein
VLSHPAGPVAATGPLLLADISGYTGLLQGVAVAHADQFVGGVVPPAYDMVSSLVDGIVARLVPPFTLAKLEGDAVFAYGTDDAATPHGPDLLACVADCHASFRARLAAARDIWVCPCSACAVVDRLELKFVLHHGSFAIQQIVGQRELAGADVVIVHRLLKNGAAQALGSGAYLLVTEAAAAGLDVPTDAAVRLVETYQHLDPITTYAFALARP